MKIAQRIRDLRKSKGMSQNDLAVKMDVVPATVSSWETANSIPPIAHLIGLSKLFNVTTDYLIGAVDSIENKICTQEQCTYLQEKVSLLEVSIKDKELLIDFLMRQLDLIKNNNGAKKQ